MKAAVAVEVVAKVTIPLLCVCKTVNVIFQCHYFANIKIPNSIFFIILKKQKVLSLSTVEDVSFFPD